MASGPRTGGREALGPAVERRPRGHRECEVVQADPGLVERVPVTVAVLGEAEPDPQPVVAQEHLAPGGRLGTSRPAGTRAPTRTRPRSPTRPEPSAPGGGCPQSRPPSSPIPRRAGPPGRHRGRIDRHRPHWTRPAVTYIDTYQRRSLPSEHVCRPAPRVRRLPARPCPRGHHHHAGPRGRVGLQRPVGHLVQRRLHPLQRRLGQRPRPPDHLGQLLTNWGVWANHPNTGGVKSYPNATRTIGKRISTLGTLGESVQRQRADERRRVHDRVRHLVRDNANEIMLWMNKYGAVGPLGTLAGHAPPSAATPGTSTGFQRRQPGVLVRPHQQHQLGHGRHPGRSATGSADRGWFGDVTLGNVQFGYEITSSSGGKDFVTNNVTITAT